MYYSKPAKTLLAAGDRALGSIIGAVEKSLHDGPLFVKEEEGENEYFYKGTKNFLKEPAKNARWRLGYAWESLVPEDIKTHDYYLGGYFSPDNKFCNRVEAVIDDMRVRAIALDDGSGRGVTLFAVVDCIGIANLDVVKIRRAFAKRAAESLGDMKFAAVNICSTHTHSCIDTQGLWTGGISKIKDNFKLNKKGEKPPQGVDEKYFGFLSDRVSLALLNACLGLTPGELTFAQKDIGGDYFTNKNRPSATALVTTLTRLIFTPDDRAQTPTAIAMMAAHPDVAGLPTRDGKSSGRAVSGDYIYYMGEYLARAGYNLMFFNGAICAIYMARGATNDGLPMSYRYQQSARYGTELGKILLSLTKTRDEILADPFLAQSEKTREEMELSLKNGGGYTLWHKGWRPVEEFRVKPVFNIRLHRVKVPVLNPIIRLVGKLNLAGFRVIKEGKNKYSVFTEIGYLEIGDVVKSVMVPGEFCADLLRGGKSLTAQGSYSGKAFSCPSLKTIFSDDILAIGLANDAIGYIVPDNDYVLSDFKNHYHEEISLGRETASTLIKGFVALKNSIK